MFWFYLMMALSLLLGVLYHEYGHMKVAKKYNVTVRKFCVGMGPMIWKKKGKDGTEYGIAPLPFGGYCSIDENELDEKLFFQYAGVFLAGVIRNVMLGIVLCFTGFSLSYIIAGKFPDFALIFQTTFGILLDTFSLFGKVFVEFFNIKGMAEVGGISSQIQTLGTPFAQLQMTSAQYVGMGLAMGGGINFALALCNILPIPALDGGQLCIKGVRVFVKKLFNKEIPKQIADVINISGLVFLMAYQGIIFLCDIPAVQNFILNL